VEIINVSKNATLARSARAADNFFARLRGLLGTDSLPAGTGLVIEPCNSVHTFGMNYPIDVVFADGQNRVLKAVTGLRPRRAAVCRASRYAVELPAGTVARTGTAAGDYLNINRK